MMATSFIAPALASSEDGPVILAVARPPGPVRVTHRHHHTRGQLLGAVRGLLSVDAGDSRWVIPVTHAVWIPPDVSHGIRSHGPFSGWSVYVKASACDELPCDPGVISVSGLLREVIVRAASWSSHNLDATQSRLAYVILDEIRTSPQVALGLPMPKDDRLLKIARELLDRPDDNRSLERWAQWAAIAPRTLTRRFVTETGFNFTEWRQRVRLLRALEMLAEGRPVTTIALNLGYDNVSAFIALFRRVFGVTPGRYKDVKNHRSGLSSGL